MATGKPSILHTLTKACLGGALLYSVVDQASDLSTFFIVKQLALDVAQRNEELRDQLGIDDAGMHTSPWYDSSIRFSHDAHIATAIFTLHGSRKSTDIQVQVVDGWLGVSASHPSETHPVRPPTVCTASISTSISARHILVQCHWAT